MSENGKGRVAGKTALVTGAAGGLGAAIAALLAREGARVALTDIDVDNAAKAAAAIGEGALAFAHDVTDETRWAGVLAEVAEAFGGLHILINCAGIGFGGDLEELSLDDWRRVHAVNLDSVFLGCKHALPVIHASGGGSVVNISSVAGIIASHNLAPYNSSKAAVRHLTKSVALYCTKKGYNIRCNSVHPAFIDTPIIDGMAAGMDRDVLVGKLARQIPMGRIGEPDDVAYGVLYLASDESKFVTASELVIDGGITAT